MGRLPRVTLGLAGILVGVVAAHLLAGDRTHISEFDRNLLIATGASFLIFTGCKLGSCSVDKQVFLGVGGAYGCVLALLAFDIFLTDEGSNGLIWLPVNFVYFIGRLAPMLLMTFLGTSIIFGWSRRRGTPSHEAPGS
jgi:hypothetical protein